MRNLLFFVAVYIPFPAIGQSYNHNFIQETILLDEKGTKAITNVTYFDGLGKEIEDVTSASGTGVSIYSAKCYDGKGRLSKLYLPVPRDPSMSFQSVDALSEYSTRYYNNDNTAFSQFEYDVFGSVIKEEIPGTIWRRERKGTSSDFGSNTESDLVLHYEAPLDQEALIEPSSTKFKYYPAGSLSKETKTDADGHYSSTFKDMFGNIILERRNIGDMYFIYNDLGQLRYVLTPQYQLDSKRELHVYEYQYDSRDNLVRKKLPGCEHTQFWYDKEKRLTIVQDANLRQKHKYRFILYDKFGRLAVQGLCSNFVLSSNDAPIVTFQVGQGGVLATNYLLEERYKNLLEAPELEIVNYYDSYAFLSGAMKNDFITLIGSGLNYAAGYQTGSVVRASNGEFVFSVMSYDRKGNILSTRTKTLGGFSENFSNTYTFTDQIQSTTIDADVKCGEYFKAIHTNTYNPYNDKLSEGHVMITYGEENADIVMKYSYDDLGRLKNVVRPIVGHVGVGKVSYQYDLHGWTTAIMTNSFQEQLHYADGNGTPCYNGNISSVLWNNAGSSIKRGYTFSYDELNRLNNAVYSETEAHAETLGHFNEQMRYDVDGNITSLKRFGLRQDGTYGLIDDLTMKYQGVQLSWVRDMATQVLRKGSFDFKGAEAHYQYNGNGSLISDSGKGIALIEYDNYNLPRRIQFTNGNVTEYVFTATGKKLRTTYYVAVPNIDVAMGCVHELSKAEILRKDSIDYLLGGNLILKNAKIDKYLFVGGYIQQDNVLFPSINQSHIGNSGMGGDRYIGWIGNENRLNGRRSPAFKVYFYNNDHLGNIREVVDEMGTVVQANDFYPLGTPFSDSISLRNINFQPYKYNAKELDRMHGLDWYDYGARMYDPVIGKWNAVDPLAEKYYGVSPYAYCANNPVIFVDPDGRKFDFSKMTKGEYQSYLGQINPLRKASPLFNTMYSSLENSKETYFISFGKVTSVVKGDREIDGHFVMDEKGGGSIVFNRDKLDAISHTVFAEELFHAYQHDNRDGYAQGEFNREFEAKTFVTAFAYEVGKPFPTYNGMEGFLARLKEGRLYGSSYEFLTPKDVRSKQFLFDYFFSAGFYSQYNRINGVGGSSYRERTAVIPYALQKIILDTYNK